MALEQTEAMLWEDEQMYAGKKERWWEWMVAALLIGPLLVFAFICMVWEDFKNWRRKERNND